MPFWLGNTRGARGLEVLRRVIKEDPSAEVQKKAVFGISQSQEPQAVDVADRHRAEQRRRQPCAAKRSSGSRRRPASKAAAAITERIEQDPDTEVKKKAVFALSQLPKDEGVPLLHQGRAHPHQPAVRKQAMFWLGQSKDPRALDFFAEVLK